MRRLMCRLGFHQWRWVGWSITGNPLTSPEDELFVCEHCPATTTATFGG